MSQKNNSVVGSVFWSCVQTFSSQFVTIVITTILARLVAPEAYGLLAASSIFTSLAGTLATGGINNAIIQKKDADDADISSLFYFTIFFSCVIYLILFFLAPFLVKILDSSYDYQLLITLLRVQGLSVFFSCLSSFFGALQEKWLWFKNLSLISVCGAVISGAVGIILAYNGAGVWALVVQQLLGYLIKTIFLVITTKWIPKWLFSIKRLKPMLKYGIKMMFTGLTITIYSDLTSLIIGNRYSAESLAFYNKGTSYPKTLALSATTAVNTAIFPIMSRMQAKDDIKSISRQYSRISAFLITPIMLGLAAVAPALVILLLGEQWGPAIPFFQICCINYSIQPIAMANLQFLKADGLAGEYLKLDLYRKGIGVVLLLIAVSLGASIELIAISEVVANFIAIFINVVPGKKYLHYSIREQFVDIVPKYLIAFVMFVVVSWIGTLISSIFPRFVVQVSLGAGIYILLARCFRMRELKELVDLLRNIKKSK